MTASVFELFRIGIGPSSSHTVGPMRAARAFVAGLDEDGLLESVARLRVDLYGSLAATGPGHGTPKAVLLGLEGELPEAVDVESIPARVTAIGERQSLCLLGRRDVAFVRDSDLLFHPDAQLPAHPNGLRFAAFDAAGETLRETTCYSVGGGAVRYADADPGDTEGADVALPFPFASAAELLAACTAEGLPVSGVMRADEIARRPEDEVRAGLAAIWTTMQACVTRGCRSEGVLPGGLELRRRAPGLYRQLSTAGQEGGLGDPLTALDWVGLYALAVNEENAGGGRVVTAPTNGAAGIVPAVLHYYRRWVPGADDDGVERFLLVAAAIGSLYKENASLSGAEVGCQGEVGVACSMAAGALAEVLGGTPEQVENAAEIGMEHNLGLTCDPVGGLVQVPCIERNAMGAVKAITAARMALRGDGEHLVSLDRVIRTMRDTGRDMASQYKETARGGLAVTTLDVPVNVIEC
jgi:L-serine dehydratase